MMDEYWNIYGPTAARPRRDKRGVAAGVTTIDIHAHAGVAEAADYVASHLDWTTIPLAHFTAPDSKAINQKQEKDRASRMFGLQDRLTDMDDMGIDIQVVMPPPVQCYHTLPVDIAVPAARIVNDGIAEYAAQCPDRLLPFGTVPMQDGKAAVAELERCVKQLGFRGVEILTNVAGKELSDPDFETFWQAAEALGVLIVIHPNGFTEGRRLSRHYFNNIIGNPFETTLALHYLIFDGVLECYPGLKILAVHGGGYLGAYAGRIDHAWGARSDSQAGLPRPPSSYLKQIYFDSVVFTSAHLQLIAETQGIENILMGTDYPYDMGEYAPVEHIQSVENFDPVSIGKIVGGNTAWLLKLDDLFFAKRKRSLHLAEAKPAS